MLRSAIVAALALAACSDSGTEPDPIDTPPAVWSVTVDTANIAGFDIVDAEARLDATSSVSMRIGCANQVGDTDAPTRSVALHDLLNDFGSAPFVVSSFRPDVGSGGIGWDSGFEGRSISVWNEESDPVLRRLLGADSVTFSYARAGGTADHTFDTRALGDAVAVLTDACGWTP